ncbi:hypothetical protein QMQ05_15440 [Glutamicibacter ectropisis]|uniref:Uncharacterized protein n=1 Tax=Glutamicibacter ectropisis TaxID=3046593 RepID=A0AAU6WIS0_9MICC
MAPRPACPRSAAWRLIGESAGSHADFLGVAGDRSHRLPKVQISAGDGAPARRLAVVGAVQGAVENPRPEGTQQLALVLGKIPAGRWPRRA